jgi:hypothetical protein
VRAVVVQRLVDRISICLHSRRLSSNQNRPLGRLTRASRHNGKSGQGKARAQRPAVGQSNVELSLRVSLQPCTEYTSGWLVG